MKKITLVLFCCLVSLLFSVSVFADGDDLAVSASDESAIQEENFQLSTAQDDLILSLLAQIEALAEQNATLADQIAELTLQINNPMPTLQQAVPSIGVMPVQGKDIPGVDKESIRAMILSAVSAAGVEVFESMDNELLDLNATQRQLVYQGQIQESTAPETGQLNGIMYYLIPTVTIYDVTENDPSWGGVNIQVQNVRERHANLRIDFRLVNAVSGSGRSFFVSSARNERTGAILFDASFDSRSIAEIVLEDALQQATDQFVLFLGVNPTEEQSSE